MGTKLRPIEKVNYPAIAGMQNKDVLEVREYYILHLVQAKGRNDSDTMDSAINWICALTHEMRMRGDSIKEENEGKLVGL